MDNIPLVSARTDDLANSQHQGGANDQDDELIGEEVRPLPIDRSMDARLQALHAILQDHTYVLLPKKSAGTTPGGSGAAGALASPVPSRASLMLSPKSVGKQSTTSQIIDSVAAGAGGPTHYSPNNSRIGANVASTGPSNTQANAYAAKYNPQQQSTQANSSLAATAPAANAAATLIPGYPFGYSSAEKGKRLIIQLIRLDRSRPLSARQTTMRTRRSAAARGTTWTTIWARRPRRRPRARAKTTR